MLVCPFCSQAPGVEPRPDDRAVLIGCGQCMNAFALQSDGASSQTHPLKGVPDVRQTAHEGSIGGELLRLFPEIVERLPVLPEIAHRVLEVVRDPESSMEDVAEVVNQDQVIALKVLQVANSVAYGGLTEIKDLRAACARLGMRQVANTVQAVAIANLHTIDAPALAEVAHGLWRHAVATAHCAFEIAVELAETAPEALFVAGLVHDVGKAAILCAADCKEGPLADLSGSPQLLTEVFAGYHNLIGLHIVQHWGLPAEFGVTTYCHDHIDTVPDDAWLHLVHIVSLSTAIASHEGFGITQGDQALVSHPSAKFLNMNDVKLATLRVDLEDKIAPLLEIGST